MSDGVHGYYRQPTLHDDTMVFVSEDDLWVEPEDGRTRPYEAAAAVSGDDAAAQKEVAKAEAEEKDRARKFNEMRKSEARTAYERAGSSAYGAVGS